MAYYLDYVGLNTFIYESVGWNPEEQYSNANQQGRESQLISSVTLNFEVEQNHIGWGGFASGSAAYTKNFRFPAHLVDPQTGAHATTAAGLLRATASFLPALILHRNGPYGFPTWKQIRVGDNPLTRRQRKENIFTFVREPGEEFSYRSGGRRLTLRNKYGAIEKYDECPVTSKYKPFLLSVGSEQKNSFQRFGIRASYGNAIAGFNNDEVNNYYDLNEKESEAFNLIKNEYLNGGLEGDSMIDSFEKLMYSEVIFPQKLYTYKKYKRQRTTFSFPWHNQRLERNPSDKVNTGCANTIASQSVWPLDPSSTWLTRSAAGGYGFRLDSTDNHGFGLASLYGEHNDSGILWNTYSSFHADAQNLIIQYSFARGSSMGTGPIYARRHMIADSSSVVAPVGMKLEGVNFLDTGSVQYSDISRRNLPTGDAFWDTPSQSNNAPFDNSYDLWFESLRGRYKEYTIVPEFRISNHVATYEKLGATEENPHMLEMTGGLENTTGSSETNFYKVYTNTDFMEHFEFVKKEHKGFIDPSAIFLKCKAAIKFVPYDGFYPVQRTVDIAQQFYSSYSGSVAFRFTGSYAETGDPSIGKIGLQPLVTPIFAPGVLYNSIKSGVAVDYPIFTGSVLTTFTDGGLAVATGSVGFEDYTEPTLQNHVYVTTAGDGVINFGFDQDAAHRGREKFDLRIPFRALYEPERFLAGYRIVTNEPHPSGNLSASCQFDGTGDNLYKKMVHNFLAEVPEFFMKNKNFSRISSLRSSHAKVGNVVKDRHYMMRVRMYRTYESSSVSIDDTRAFETPQQENNTYENFTMYSRPSAFGPPSYIRLTNSRKKTIVGSSLNDISPWRGQNYCFTPPYYYGQAWADIKYIAPETGKVTLNDIIRNSTVTYYRHVFEKEFVSGWSTGGAPAGSTARVNDLFLQLSASLELFGRGIIKKPDREDIVGPTSLSSDDHNWVIHPHFETPMLNFSHLSHSSSLSLPLAGSESVPRGMWHQYGLIEEDPNKGIFMQVTDVPPEHIETVLGGTATKYVSAVGDVSLTGSLADVCGFDTTPVKMGALADEKRVYEAVVAIPFIEDEGRRRFFTIDKDEYTIAKLLVNGKNAEGYKRITGITADPSKGVLEMTKRMRKYVFPPSMDFYNNSTVDPFAMYIFEFSHKFNKQDLSNIWQGVMPEVGKTQKEATAFFGHKLLEEEMLREDKNIPDRLKWMVFKVKQRAKINYYDKILQTGRSISGMLNVAEESKFDDILSTDAGDVERGPEKFVDISYNWPYDFFSLVELVKIEARVRFADEEEAPASPADENKPNPRIVTKIKSKTKPKEIREKRTYIKAAGVTKFFYEDGSHKFVPGDLTNR